VIDEPFWILIAVTHVPTDDGDAASLAYTFRTETPAGSTWDPVVEREEEWIEVAPSDVLIFWERFATYPEDPQGEYVMDVTVEDQVDGERLRTEESFELANGGEAA
jgi:hypothetical protein